MPWLIGISIASIICGVLAWRQWWDAYHFAVVDPGVLYRDGVRTIREFEIAVRRAKPRTIVRLIDEREQHHEPFTSEAAYCQAHGIAIVELPVPLGGWPASAQIDEFLNLVADPKARPVLVHCAQGVRRTGMLVAAYQESVLGYDPEKAKAAMLRFGHSQRTVGDVMKFIEVYDPKNRTLPATLPVGNE